MHILIRATNNTVPRGLKGNTKYKVTVECEVTTERNIRINNKHTLQ